ncbi:hypothetical protein RA28_02870 [Ruegeria sp. ANG-S4]|uniref:winged helix-turn-helix domain-containing protein n=1 Tax=Ruegeria sp. ANG-S4 TaxID=1577904 RepID=UPI00057D1B3B|nr:winged helix-turn-helix domain-containing protein [Ruegeria sp. ANG-S4]KIC46726.1 hypothetical protein RA28_02870 [Ruegeria sp. ANG-S4]
MQLLIDDWRVDVAARTATRGGEKRQLSPRAIKLLQILAQAEGAVVSRDQLLEQIWPNVFVSDESLTQVVSELRRVLKDRGIVATVPRGGYRLTRPVRERARDGFELTDLDTSGLEARALCLEARDELVRCGPGAIQHAETLTAEAIDLCPDSSEIRTERAVALIRSHLYWSEGRNTLPQALCDAQFAVRVAPTSAPAHSALGYAHSSAGHWDAAEAAHQRALASDPHCASAYHFAAWFLMSRRRLRPAIRFFEQVGNLEPANIKGYLHAAQLSSVREPERCRRNAERVLVRARHRFEADPSDTRALVAIACAMALLGENASAFATIESIDTTGSAQAVYLASALSTIGERDRAILTLEELFDHGWRDLDWLFVDPAFVSLSSDRRFTRMRDSLKAA